MRLIYFHDLNCYKIYCYMPNQYYMQFVQYFFRSKVETLIAGICDCKHLHSMLYWTAMLPMVKYIHSISYS